MNKQIILSILTIMLVVGGVTGATYAFFSDQGSVLGNTFSTGTLTVALSDTDEVDMNTVSAAFGGTLNPGQCANPAELKIKNIGTVVGDHVKLAFANTNTDANSNAGVGTLDRFLRVDSLKYAGVEKIGSINNSNGNLIKDLDDLAAASNGLGNLALTDLNTDHLLVMTVCLDATAGNTLQGDSVTSAITVTLNQAASQ